MKILAVSLLRLGDIIMHDELLMDLQKKYPKAKIDLLINKQFESVQSVLSKCYQNIYVFDRTNIQKSLVEGNYNIFWGYQSIAQLVQDLELQEYDIVINLTYNKLSAYLCSLIPSKQKNGLHVFNNQFIGLENPWAEHLNHHFSAYGRSVFHYLEVLSKSLGIEISKNKEHNYNPKSHLILMQCLTNDIKKNWELEKFKKLKTMIQNMYPHFEIKILAAEFEKKILMNTFEEGDLYICSLKEAYEICKQSRLLISVDTSIKHLAAKVNIPIIEISTGSSDAIKTGPWSAASVSITPSTSCYPCSHSHHCQRETIECAESISVETVFKQVEDVLNHKEISLENPQIDLEKKIWSSYLNREDRFIVYNENDFEKIQSTQNDFEKILLTIKQTRSLDEIALSKENIQASDYGFYFNRLIQSACLNDLAGYQDGIIEVEKILQMRSQCLQEGVKNDTEVRAVSFEITS